MKFDEFYQFVKWEWKCTRCEYTTPHRNKARAHAWSKHGQEIEQEPVVVKYPEREKTPEENAILVVVEPAVKPMKANKRVEVADKIVMSQEV